MSRGIPRTDNDGKRRGNIHVEDLLGWYVRAETSKKWRFFHKPKYPFHSAVAKQYGDELPLGDHIVIVKEGQQGEEMFFIVTNITTTYVRPHDGVLPHTSVRLTK